MQNSVLNPPIIDLRLVGGQNPHQGRVEVNYRGSWGTVCHGGWDLADADVVCRQLGFAGAVSVQNGAYFGEGTGPIWLDDVRCNGSEHSLSHCLHRGWGSHSCMSNHSEDAGVTCERKL